MVGPATGTGRRRPAGVPSTGTRPAMSDADAGTGAARSAAWYAGDGRDAFIHRAWMRRGLPDHAFDGRPQIVICNTWSDLTPCNGHFREIAEHVKRGVWEAGGVPLEMPVPSLGET